MSAADSVKKFGQQVVDSLTHHPEDRVETIAGKTCVVREQALDVWAHRQSQTVLSSPDGKMDGLSVENRGSSASQARGKCMSALEVIAQTKYPEEKR